MKNIDKDIAGNVHLFIALRRRKDNPEGKEICFRQICIDHDTDLECIRARIKKHEGNWRIHKTINLRDTEKACKLLMKNLIEDPTKHTRLMSEYKTQLMRRESKAERNILLDIDNDDDLSIRRLCTLYAQQQGAYKFSTCSPNGCHIVIRKCDTRCFENMEGVTMQRDGYYFIEQHKIGNNE